MIVTNQESTGGNEINHRVISNTLSVFCVHDCNDEVTKSRL